jgi:hypothetical protein
VPAMLQADNAVARQGVAGNVRRLANCKRVRTEMSAVGRPQRVRYDSRSLRRGAGWRNWQTHGT